MSMVLLDSLSKITGVSFVSFVYTTKGTGEKARYVLNVGANKENLYRKDVAVLTELLPTLDAGSPEFLAATELLISRNTSLEVGIGNNPRYTNADTYTAIRNTPGVKIHNETGELYVTGLLNRKDTITEGAPRKKVNSSAKTIAKRKIEKTLPSGGFRQFSLDQVSVARMNGDTLVFE